MKIGPTLKHLRVERGYTLNEVADKIGISASLLSQIENTKSNPSLQSLEGLLSLYAVSFSDFFRQAEQRDFVFVRASETESFKNEGGGYTLSLLASKLQNNTLESYLLDLETGGSIDAAVIDADPNGERMIFVLSGECSVRLSGAGEFTLSEGDSINYKSRMACTISNEENTSSKLLITGTPPLFR